MKIGSLVQKCKVFAIFGWHKKFCLKSVAILLALPCCTNPAFAGLTYAAGPENYLPQLKMLHPGDHLWLQPGEYNQGLPVRSGILR